MNDKLLPEHLKHCFWEVDFSTLDPKKYPRYIVERVLEYGTPLDLKWLLVNYPKETIIETVKKTRQLSKKRANYWQAYFKIPKEEILCLSKHYRTEHNVIWQR